MTDLLKLLIIYGQKSKTSTTTDAEEPQEVDNATIEDCFYVHSYFKI